jgi:hypothetical protein
VQASRPLLENKTFFSVSERDATHYVIKYEFLLGYAWQLGKIGLKPNYKPFLDHHSWCDSLLVLCHTRNDRRAFHGSTMGKLTQSTECHQSKRDRLLVLCHTFFNRLDNVRMVRNVGANGIACGNLRYALTIPSRL